MPGKVDVKSLFMRAVRIFSVAYINDHMICYSGSELTYPYEEWFFEKGEWHFLRNVHVLPKEGEENVK